MSDDPILSAVTRLEAGQKRILDQLARMEARQQKLLAAMAEGLDLGLSSFHNDTLAGLDGLDSIVRDIRRDIAAVGKPVSRQR
jgi:hypothetical protein